MDFLEAYAPQAFALYNTYYAPYARYLLPLQRFLLHSQSLFYTTLFPYLYPLLRLSSSLLSSTPSLPTLALLALVLLISLKVLDMLRRTIMYWVSLALKLVFWAAVAGAGVYVYGRGVEQTVEDVGWVVGLLAGLEDEGKRVGEREARGRRGRAEGLGKKTPRGRTRGKGW